MARVRGIGELNWSPFHGLPNGVDPDNCFFTLKLDHEIGDPSVESIFTSPEFEAKEKSLSFNAMVILDALSLYKCGQEIPNISHIWHAGNRSEMMPSVLLDNLVCALEKRGSALGQPENDDDMDPIDPTLDKLAAKMEMDGGYYADDDYCHYALAVQLPILLVQALNSSTYTIGVHIIPGQWDTSESERHHTLIFEVIVDEPIENTDRFLRSFARKLARWSEITLF